MKSAEARLRYYAERFSTVEVDSTYYRLPDETMVSRWAERTPDGFVMHVKAFGVMTRHPVKVEQLPPDLREAAPVDDRGRVDRPPREFRAEVFRRFHRALEPLRETGKLGGILLQFPSVRRLQGRLRRLPALGRRAAPGRPRARRVPPPELARRGAPRRDPGAPRGARRLQRRRGRAEDGGEEPRPDRRRGHEPARLRSLHGRNAGTWNARGGSASDRFDYLYSDDELEEWVEPLRKLGESAEEVYVLFNNNRWSRTPQGELAAQAPANAGALRRILDVSGVPTA